MVKPALVAEVRPELVADNVIASRSAYAEVAESRDPILRGDGQRSRKSGAAYKSKRDRVGGRRDHIAAGVLKRDLAPPV